MSNERPIQHDDEVFFKDFTGNNFGQVNTLNSQRVLLPEQTQRSVLDKVSEREQMLEEQSPIKGYGLDGTPNNKELEDLDNIAADEEIEYNESNLNNLPQTPDIVSKSKTSKLVNQNKNTIILPDYS